MAQSLLTCPHSSWKKAQSPALRAEAVLMWGPLPWASLSQEALALELASLSTAGVGVARGSWCQLQELLPACFTCSPPPLDAPDSGLGPLRA